MDEGLVLHQPFSVIVPHIDMIAEHIIVFDLQRGDSGGLDIALLQSGNQPAAFITKGAKLVQRRVISGPDKAAVAGQKRHLVGKRRCQFRRQRCRGHDRRIQPFEIGRLRRQLICATGTGCGTPDHVGGGAQRLGERLQVARPAMSHRQP